MITYKRLLVRTGNDYISLPGARPGLRIVGVQTSSDGIVLDALCPQPNDRTYMYSEEEGKSVTGYKGITRISVEVVAIGADLQMLDAKDFVGFVGEGEDQRAVFASVRA